MLQTSRFTNYAGHIFYTLLLPKSDMICTKLPQIIIYDTLYNEIVLMKTSFEAYTKTIEIMFRSFTQT